MNGGSTKIAPEVKKAGVAVATGEVEFKTVTTSVEGKVSAVNTTQESQTTPTQPGIYEFSIEQAFVDGEQITINGTTYTFKDRLVLI